MNLLGKKFRVQTKKKPEKQTSAPVYEEIENIKPQKLTIKTFEPVEMASKKGENEQSTIQTEENEDVNDLAIANQIYCSTTDLLVESNQIVSPKASSTFDLHLIEELPKQNQRKSVPIVEPKIKRRIITDVIGGTRQQASLSQTPDEKNNDSLVTSDNRQSTSLSNSSNPNKSRAFGNYFSVIYGFFLFFLGIFLSLDTYSGTLGSSRVVSAVFFIILFGISIFWIVYLYFDIKAFSRLLINQNTKITKDQLYPDKQKEPPIYSSLYDYTSSRGRLAMIMSTRVKSANIDYFSNVNLNEETVKEASELKGYLKDVNAPYNLYLRVGIGVFCTATLFGCLIDIIESIGTNFQCGIENFEALIAVFQFIFSLVEFAFIFTRGNIVICKNEQLSSFFMMHLIVTNLIVWAKHILLETLNEYFIEIIREYLYHSPSSIDNFNFRDSTNLTLTFSNTLSPATVSPNTTILEELQMDCYGNETKPILKYAASFKPYFYPFIIEFSVITATIFGIMWSRIGSGEHATSLIPIASENTYQGKYSPNPSKLILLDCTKTFKGLMFGLLVVIMTLLCTAVFYVFSTEQYSPKYEEAVLLSEIVELVLLVMALIITILGYFKVKKHYTKVAPETNIFDVILEVLSLCGIYSFSCNQLIAIFSSSSHSSEAARSSGDHPDSSVLALSAISAVFSIIQGTLQTLFILMCLKRYAFNNKEFVDKPARELITALLLINVSMWIFDSFSAKRFDTNIIIIEHFTILKWSIINAFSTPIAIFYRFHSSVCLSDIWYCLYYGEHDEHEENHDNHNEEAV